MRREICQGGCCPPADLMKCGFGWQVGNQCLVDELEIYQGCRMDLQISRNLLGLLRTDLQGLNLCMCGGHAPPSSWLRGESQLRQEICQGGWCPPADLMKCGFGWQVGNQYLVDELEIYQGCRMDLQISWNLVGLLRTGFRGVNLCTCGACTPVAPAAR